MKRLLVLIFALTVLPAFGEEIQDINMTPQNTYSGYYNKSNIHTTYPKFNTTTQNPRADLMKKRSIHEMNDTSPKLDGKTPMTYSQFPKNYDSSNMMLQQGIQNGMQNMFMGL